MKNMLLAIAVIGVALFASCEKDVPETPEQPTVEPPEEEKAESIAGTTWICRYEKDDVWMENILNLTSTQRAIYSENGSRTSKRHFTGRYFYNPPHIYVFSDNISFEGRPPTATIVYPYEICHEGMVHGDTMTLAIEEGGESQIMVFKKQ